MIIIWYIALANCYRYTSQKAHQSWMRQPSRGTTLNQITCLISCHLIDRGLGLIVRLAGQPMASPKATPQKKNLSGAYHQIYPVVVTAPLIEREPHWTHQQARTPWPWSYSTTITIKERYSRYKINVVKSVAKGNSPLQIVLLWSGRCGFISQYHLSLS